MKMIRTLYLFVAIAAFAFGCKKSGAEDSGPACEVNETTKVTFTNSGSATVRIEMATQFNAQFMPVSPVFSFDLAPGASSVREFRYGRYFIQWKANCSTTCTQKAFYAKDFNQCEEYQETR